MEGKGIQLVAQDFAQGENGFLSNQSERSERGFS